MALTNFLPRTVTTTGASLTGSDGGSNRTYTLSDSEILSSGFVIVVNNATLQEGAAYDFTISDTIITFLNPIWDTSIISINYFITFGASTAASLSTTTSLKYATPLMFAEMLGIMKDIPSWDVAGTPVKEEVGTGDDSKTTFYLDQKSVVSDSYTFYYGASETSVTALTETTHYTLDNDTGTLLLTSAGVTVVSTNKIYAKYKYYSNGMKDSYIISILSRAEKEVDGVINSAFTDGTQDNPDYPIEIEIQPSGGYFMDKTIVKNKPLIDIETTLDGDITDSDATISLLSGAGASYPSSGYIVINSEVITYTGISTDDLTGCTRGVLGTTAASHDDGDAVHSTIFFLSNTSEGTAVTFTIQPWDTKMYVTEEGLFYSFSESVFSASQYTDRLAKQDVANRVKIIYLYGYNTVPGNITRLTLLFAKRQLIQDNIGSSMIKGRDEFKPEMFNVDLKEIEMITGKYIILPMGNT